MSNANDEQIIQLPKVQFDAMQSQISQLQSQLDWFKRQLFGPTSEKRPLTDEEQLALFAAHQFVVDGDVDANAAVTVPEHKRRKHRAGDEVNDSGLRFGPDVPTKIIVIPCPGC
ncbi:MAG: transposase [Burkholderiaceae bacterium]